MTKVIDAYCPPCSTHSAICTDRDHNSGRAIRARIYTADLISRPLELVMVAGHDLNYWWDADTRTTGIARRPIAFTSGMVDELGRLSAAVIGVSGTGSIVAEQLCVSDSGTSS